MGIRGDAVGDSDVGQGAAFRSFGRRRRRGEFAASLRRKRAANLLAATPQLPAGSLRPHAAMLGQRRRPKTSVQGNSHVSHHEEQRLHSARRMRERQSKGYRQKTIQKQKTISS